jgi:hypothetical protein
MRQVRRALIASRGQPLRTRDLLSFAFPVQPHPCWHYWSIYRAAPRYATKAGRYWLPIR